MGIKEYQDMLINIKNRKLSLETLIQVRTISLVEDSDLNIFSKDNETIVDDLTRLRKKVQNKRSFAKDIKRLCRDMTYLEKKLSDTKEELLLRLEEIEQKGGKKRLQKNSYYKDKKNFYISERYYSLYNSVLSNLKGIDSLLAELNSINFEDKIDIVVDEEVLKNMTPSEKAKYWNNIGLLICMNCSGDDSVVVDDSLSINSEYASLFNRSVDEYKKNMQIVLREEKKKKYLNSFVSIKDRISSCMQNLANASWKKKIAIASLYLGITGGALSLGQMNDYNEVDQASRKIEMETFEDDLLAKEDFKVEEESAKENPNSEIVVEINQNDDEYYFSESLSDYNDLNDNILLSTVSTDVDKEVEEMNTDNEDIIRGYHLTYNNTTYPMSDVEFTTLLYVVQHECNGTYEDALTVISIILNRVEDERYKAYSPIDVVTADGQFQVWDEDKAAYFLDNSEQMVNPDVYSALYDAVYLGVRNNDYVEFKAASSSDYARNGEYKFQFVENGNKVHNLALNLDRTDNAQKTFY